PSGYDYDFDTKMTTATEHDVVGDDVEASLREAQEVLKVAETGTLDQRAFACSSSAPLVQQAERRLAAYRQQGARPDRVAELEASLKRIEQVQKAAFERCQE